MRVALLPLALASGKSPATRQQATRPPQIQVMIFDAFSLSGLELKSRYAMAPMTRAFAPDGIPTEANAAYYRRRAAGGAGLIITEGVYVDHPTAGAQRDVPVLHGDAALAGWRLVTDAVHAENSRIFAQLWHVGLARSRKDIERTGLLSSSPSGCVEDGVTLSEPMTQRDIEEVVAAFVRSAANARKAGFDGIELHAAHGYLIDTFLWERTNQRTDAYGGDIQRRTRLACDIIAEIKRSVGPGFLVDVRLSQWKQQDYRAVLAHTPAEWEAYLTPMVEAGADIFHISTRRFWEPAFEGNPSTLAALTKQITGKPVIAVGSAGLTQAKEPGWERGDDWSIAPVKSIEYIEEAMARGDFDLIAMGRILLANPDWGHLVRAGRFDELRPYTRASRDILY